MIESTLDREEEIKKILGWIPDALDLVSQEGLPLEFGLVLGSDDTTRGTLEEWMQPLKIRKKTIPNKNGPIDGFYAALLDPDTMDVPVHLYLDAGQFDITKVGTLEAIAALGDKMLSTGALYGNMSRTNIRLAYNDTPSQMREINELILALLLKREDDIILNPYNLVPTTREAIVFSEGKVVESTSASAALNTRHELFDETARRMRQDSSGGLLDYFACEDHLVTLCADLSHRVISWVRNEANYFPPAPEDKETERALRLIHESGKVAQTSAGDFLRSRFHERGLWIKATLENYYPEILVDRVMGEYSSFLR